MPAAKERRQLQAAASSGRAALLAVLLLAAAGFGAAANGQEPWADEGMTPTSGLADYGVNGLGALQQPTQLLPQAGGDPLGMEPTAMGFDPLAQPAAAYELIDGGMGVGPGPAPVMMTQPVNWISGPYLKAGVASAIGDDLLESQDAGYAISGGYRVPLGPAFDERLFLDFGGSYLSVFGETTRTTDGIRFDRNILTNVTAPPLDVADAFSTTLQEVKRGAAHVAMGWYLGELLDQRSNDPQLRIAARLGGRFGHVRGRFNDVLIADPSDEQFVVSTFQTRYSRTNTIGGLFAAAEAVLLARDTAVGSMALTLDGEFANDWIEFGGFQRGSLGTASAMLGFMLSR